MCKYDTLPLIVVLQISYDPNFVKCLSVALSANNNNIGPDQLSSNCLMMNPLPHTAALGVHDGFLQPLLLQVALPLLVAAFVCS